MKSKEKLHTAKEESFDIAHPEVSIASVSSEISIIESLDGKCHVKILADSNKSLKLAELVEIIAKGESLSIRVDKKSRSSWGMSVGLRGLIIEGGLHGLSIELALPQASNVKIKTVSGDIEINQALTNVEIGAVSANIAISKNPSETCTIKTISGDIAAHIFSGCDYKLKSISGNITAHVAPDLAVEVDGNSISGELNSEISLNESSSVSSGTGKVVGIAISTISGDFNLVKI